MRIPILGALVLAALAPAASARDLLVTSARPQNLYVFDAASRQLMSDCDLGQDPTPSIIQMSPDGKIAYLLVNHWQDVIGVDILTCQIVFRAVQSDDEVQRRSIGSLAVSKDGAHLYTVRNPVRHLADRYEVMEPEFAVFDTAAGLEAKPTATFPAPRRSTIMATDEAGKVYIGGREVYAVDPSTGEITTAIPNASWDRPTYSVPDVLAFWPVGTQNNEFLTLYTAFVYADESHKEMTDFVWGYQTVDLTTGDTEIADFADFEVMIFSAVRNPRAPSELYGVYTQLSKYDLEKKELIKRVDLPHTYYVVNISTDGKEIYVGGTSDNIGVYDSTTLERIGEMKMPSGGDMGLATVQVVQTE